MEKTIVVGGQEIKFRASGLTPKLYRQKFGREFFADAQKLTKAFMDKDGEYTIPDLECFERLAYITAWQGNPSISDDPDEWLDTLDGLEIYQVLPEVIGLWAASAGQTASLKKKVGRPSGR